MSKLNRQQRRALKKMSMIDLKELVERQERHIHALKQEIVRLTKIIGDSDNDQDASN